MTTINELKKEQSERWNGSMGETWVQAQKFIDTMLRPVEKLLLEKASALDPKTVLDIGCGNGSTTLSIARTIAPNGICTGIDLSKPMITNALSQASVIGDDNTQFICADASDYDFKQAKFDLFVSRFGVMFFPDPVKAFNNFRKVANDNASLMIIVWRNLEENDFMMVARSACASLLSKSPYPDPTLPGPFSFGDPDRVKSILQASGWSEIKLEAINIPCAFKSVDLDFFITKLTPIGHDLNSLDDGVRDKLMRRVRNDYKPYIQNLKICFNAPCWLITAQNKTILN